MGFRSAQWQEWGQISSEIITRRSSRVSWLRNLLMTTHSLIISTQQNINEGIKDDFFDKSSVGCQQIRTSRRPAGAPRNFNVIYWIRLAVNQSWEGSKVQLLSTLSAPLTLAVNPTSRRGHRSKCLGFRVTPLAEDLAVNQEHRRTGGADVDHHEGRRTL